jgi:hypothetical protein
MVAVRVSSRRVSFLRVSRDEDGTDWSSPAYPVVVSAALDSVADCLALMGDRCQAYLCPAYLGLVYLDPVYFRPGYPDPVYLDQVYSDRACFRLVYLDGDDSVFQALPVVSKACRDDCPDPRVGDLVRGDCRGAAADILADDNASCRDIRGGSPKQSDAADTRVAAGDTDLTILPNIRGCNRRGAPPSSNPIRPTPRVDC